MLAGKLSLHDIEDVEAFCIGIFAPRAASIPSSDHEDAIAYLIETAWELSTNYDPSGMRRFSVWAGFVLRQRFIDWKRSQYGRTRWSSPGYVYERPRPSFVPLESRPDGPVDGFLGDAYTGRVSDVLGLQRARGGTGARPDQEGSRSEARSAA